MNPTDASWLSELGLDNSLLMDPHRDDFMDSFNEELVASMGQELQNCLSQGNNSFSFSSSLANVPSNNSISSSGIESGKQQINPDNFSDFSKIHTAAINPDQQPASSSSPIILNFGNNTNHAENSQLMNPRPLNPEEEAVVSEIFRSQASGNINSAESIVITAQPTKKRTRVRPPSQTYDHIIAERKRREQLSQLFIALSAIVPGLKKTDKSSVLGDAIKYLKQLQDRVESLEEQAAKQRVQSVVLVRKSQIIEEEEGSSDEKSSSSDEQLLPQIEARVCNNTILIRVHCEKHKGTLVNLLCKVETLNLAVVSTNVTAFGNLTLDITIIAEMEKEFNLTVKKVVTALRSALPNQPYEEKSV